MALRWLVSSLHLLALGIGLGSVYVRGQALRGTLDTAGLRRVFIADGFWGLAGGLWIVTGLWRVLGGQEKGSQYYLHNGFFQAKMTLLALVLLLELFPMLGLIRWRVQRGKGQPLELASAGKYAAISYVQVALVLVMVFLATGMARGLG